MILCSGERALKHMRIDMIIVFVDGISMGTQPVLKDHGNIISCLCTEIR